MMRKALNFKSEFCSLYLVQLSFILLFVLRLKEQSICSLLNDLLIINDRNKQGTPIWSRLYSRTRNEVMILGC